MKKLRLLIILTSILLPVYSWLFWSGYYFVKLPLILKLKHKVLLTLLIVLFPLITIPLLSGCYVRRLTGVRV